MLRLLPKSPISVAARFLVPLRWRSTGSCLRQRWHVFAGHFRRFYLAAFPPERCPAAQRLLEFCEEPFPLQPTDPDPPLAGVAALRAGALLYEISGESISDKRGH